jgi:drug/metabolite transporter (DMT)-like permease
LGAFSVFAGALFFSGKAILIKQIYLNNPAIDHVMLLALRMGFSLPFFLIVAFLSSNKVNSGNSLPVSKFEYFQIVLLAFGGYYLSSVFDFWGLEFVSASLERLILFVYPTFVVLISAFIYKKKITKVTLLALLLAYAGIFLVLSAENLANNSNMAIGVILVFAAAFTYACYLAGSETMINKLGNARYTSLVMSLACIFVLGHYVVRVGFEWPQLSALVVWQGLAMAVFCTVIPAFLISNGIKHIGSANAAIIASVGPVSTIFLANYFLGEKIEPIQAVGTVFVLAGVILVSLKGRK